MATLIVPRRIGAEMPRPLQPVRAEGDGRDRIERARSVGLVAVALLLAFGLRAYHLGTQSLWYDEAFSAYVVNRSWLAMAEFMASIVDNHPPLYYAVLHTFLLAGGGSEYALRFASLVPGTLCIPLTLVLVRRVASPWDARSRAAARWGAAVLLVWSPVLIWYSQEARMYMQAAAFGLAGTICLAALLDGRARRVSVAWAATGLALWDLAALYSHIFSALVVAAQGLVAMAWLLGLLARGLGARPRCVPWRRVAPVAASFVAIGVAFAPWAWFTLVRLGADQSYFNGTLPLGLYVHDVAFLLAGGDTPRPFLEGAIIVGGLLVATGVAAALGARARHSAAPWLVVACALVPPALLYALSRDHPKFSSRYLLVAAPYWYALAGLGLGQIARVRRTAMATALTALGAAALGGMLVANVLDLRRVWSGEVARDDWRAAVAYIRDNGGQGDPILLVSGHAYPALLYYAPWARWAGLPPDVTLTTAHTVGFEDASSLNRLVGDASRLWIVRWQADVVDPNGVVRALVEQRGREVVRGRYFHGVEVQGYGLSPGSFSSAPQRTTLGVAFGTDLQLEGSDAATSVWRAQSGGALTLTLYWRALAGVSPDYRLSLRLRDSAGNEWGAFDGRPGGEFNPVSRWLPGQVVAGAIRLPIAAGTPPGRYRLDAALYDPSTSQLTRLAVRDARGAALGDTAPIGTVAVERPAQPPDPTAIRPAVALSGRSGPGALVGLANPLPASVAAGDPVALRMYWMAREELANRPAFLVRVIDSKGETFAQTLTALAGDPAPVPAWRSGDVLLWQVAPMVPARAAPGPARLQVALVDEGVAGQVVDVGAIDVRPRPQAREAPTPSRPLADRFGDGIALRGYDLTPDGPATPGSSLTVTLRWAATASPARRWTVFVHLLGPGGAVAAQHDGEPASGRLPTSAWLAGDSVEDPHTFTVPRSLAGRTVALEVGLYDPVTGERDPLVGGGDSVALEQVRVGP